MKTRYGVALAAAAALVAGPAAARESVAIAGSSTVLPYAQIVAENFGEAFPQFTTVVESGGSSGGLKRFCEGVGTQYIDIANASRKIRDKEIKSCAANGVTEIIEIRIGYDGIVFAYDGAATSFDLTAKDVYLALNSESTAATLKDVNSNLPAWNVAFYVPASNHGTREVFEVKVLEAGCEAVGDFKKFMDSGMSKKEAEKKCIKMRTDGAVTEIAGDYTETLARIDSNKTGVGVFGLAFYENNKDKLQVAKMDGVEPTSASIASGEYPVSRPLYFYVKRAHLAVIPGMKEYVDFFISDKMIGPGSPLANYGLVPAPTSEREAVRKTFKTRSTL